MRDYVGTGMGKYLAYKLFNASKYAYICSPYIDQKYAGAIVQMAKRGIPIKLITTDRQAGGLYLSDYFGGYYRKSKDNDFEVLMVEGEGFVHSKMYVVDDDFAVDGSANLTYAGLWNQVNNIHVYDTPEEVSRIKNTFDKIWDYNNLESTGHKPSKQNSYYYAKRRREYYARKRRNYSYR